MFRQPEGDPPEDRYLTMDASAREDWALAFLSVADRPTLHRYYTLHARLLFELMETRRRHDLLFRLGDHLLDYFGAYISRDLLLPPDYCRYKREQLGAKYATLEVLCLCRPADERLRILLLDYMGHLLQPDGHLRLSIGDVLYADILFAEIQEVLENNLESELALRLVGLNFNHLGLLTYLQEEVTNDMEKLAPGERPAFLRQKAVSFNAEDGGDGLCYDPRWPALNRMMQDWLNTELSCAQQAAVLPPEPVKMPVDLSVAHLACLLHLLVAEGVPLNVTLKELFKFTAGSFRSRRQADISAGSLAKEFYSITQATAANVRDLLQRMICRINRDFFPVAVAIGIAYYWH